MTSFTSKVRPMYLQTACSKVCGCVCVWPIHHLHQPVSNSKKSLAYNVLWAIRVYIKLNLPPYTDTDKYSPE